MKKALGKFFRFLGRELHPRVLVPVLLACAVMTYLFVMFIAHDYYQSNENRALLVGFLLSLGGVHLARILAWLYYRLVKKNRLSTAKPKMGAPKVKGPKVNV